jgi:hypothetical protein
MIGLTVDAGDNFKKRASIPLAPCIYSVLMSLFGYLDFKMYSHQQHICADLFFFIFDLQVEEVNGIKFLVLHAGRVLAEVSVDNKDQITFCRQKTDYENGSGIENRHG